MLRARSHKKLKQVLPQMRVMKTSSAFTAGVIEYLLEEILDLSGDVAKAMKRKRITPRHVYLAIAADDELTKVFDYVTMPESGVVPCQERTTLKDLSCCGNVKKTKRTGPKK